MQISRLSDAIQCPARLVYTLNLSNKKSINRNIRDNSYNSNIFRNDANLSGITKGRIFECSIQFIMTAKSDRDSVFEDIINWFYDISEYQKRSLAQTSPLWPSKWIRDEKVLNHKLESNSWDKLYSAVHQWYKVEKPWYGHEINWEMEKEVIGKINLDGKFSIDLSGRIDLFAEGEDEAYVVELKHTKENQLEKARAQASLYVKLLDSEYDNTEISGFVYHSHKGVIEAFTDEDWHRIISEGDQDDPLYLPNIFVCEKCPNFNCSKRINDRRKI